MWINKKWKLITWLLVCLALSIFLFWNRQHPKIIESLFAFFITIISAILLNLFLKNEHQELLLKSLIVGGSGLIVAILWLFTESFSLNREIETAYFTSRKEKEIIFPYFRNIPSLRFYYADAHTIYSSFRQKNTVNINLSSGMVNEKLFDDLQAIMIINRQSQFATNCWVDINKNKNILQSDYVKEGKNNVNVIKDYVLYTKNQLSKEFKDNQFFQYISWDGFYLPRNTKVTYYPYDYYKHPFLLIEFRKFGWFDVKIEVMTTKGNTGWWQFADLIDSNIDMYDVNYGSEYLRINMKAEFYPLLSGTDNMIKYKKWVNSLFDDLYKTFDWNYRYRNAKEELVLGRLKKIQDTIDKK